MALDPAYVVAGLLVGVLVGLTGVGGGSLMTPLLILVFGMHPSTAVGTDLVFASGTKLVGTAMHQAWRGIAWRIVGLLAAGSMPAAAVTLVALNALGGRGPLITAIVSLTLAVALLLTATLLALRDTILRRLEQRAQTAASAYSPLLTVAVGAVVGVLVSLSSVGAGALGTVALLLLYPRLPLVRVVGTDIAHAVPLTLVAGLGHAWLGSFNGAILMPLLVGSIPGIILGSLAARIAPERVMRGVLAAVLVVVAGQIGKSVLL